LLPYNELGFRHGHRKLYCLQQMSTNCLTSHNRWIRSGCALLSDFFPPKSPCSVPWLSCLSRSIYPFSLQFPGKVFCATIERSLLQHSTALYIDGTKFRIRFFQSRLRDRSSDFNMHSRVARGTQDIVDIEWAQHLPYKAWSFAKYWPFNMSNPHFSVSIGFETGRATSTWAPASPGVQELKCTSYGINIYRS
jgi:hypothetical protein